jgi:protein ImuB
MWWIALLPRADAPSTPPEPTPELAWWALRWTPRVCHIDEAVLLEVQASERLFGGRRALLQRVRAQARLAGARALATAPTALAALALLRTLDTDPQAAPDAPDAPLPATGCGPRRLAATLDRMPLRQLSAARPHADTLAQLGCLQLGQLRALPREGVARRWGAGLLQALDQAYGLATESRPWIVLPEGFDQTLECPSAIEHASGMCWGAQHLLNRLAVWLAARQGGVLAFSLHWTHDRLRRSELRGGRLALRTAQPTRDVGHLARLLAEHLARTTLAAPATHLRLVADEVAPLPTASLSLLPESRATGRAGAGWAQLVERLSARLGPERVQQGQALADHRPECMTQWPRADPWGGWPPELALQPAWLLPEPLRLAMSGERPVYHGVLRLLSRPQRLESGWWHDERLAARPARRDYHVALSPQAGLVWIFLLHGKSPAWYLHGFYG